jgi:hypothetical protein
LLFSRIKICCGLPVLDNMPARPDIAAQLGQSRRGGDFPAARLQQQNDRTTEWPSNIRGQQEKDRNIYPHDHGPGTHVIFEPLDFPARLAALVPKPRVNFTRFHGVFAPTANTVRR